MLEGTKLSISQRQKQSERTYNPEEITFYTDGSMANPPDSCTLGVDALSIHQTSTYHSSHQTRTHPHLPKPKA